MSYWIRLEILVICLVSFAVYISTNELGSECTRNSQCKVRYSQCSSGVCTCRRYYAQFNSTACLESRLLGRDCLVDEQCSLRVANSTCKDSQCQCSEGFIRFRKHTCLGPAKPGNVCYSNEHCQMGNKNTRCKFVIANLFGRCVCNDKENCDSDESSKPETTTPSEEEEVDEVEPDPTTTEPESSEDHEDNHNSDHESGDKNENNQEEQESNGNNENENQESIQNSSDKESANPENNRLETDLDRFIESEINGKTTEANKVVMATDDEDVEKSVPFNEPKNGTTSGESKYRLETGGDVSQKKDWRGIQGVSLGFPCRFDAECQAEDSESRCIRGVCDCAERGSGPNSCSKDNTGCAPETFQCRSSGSCISWFFVCDGRKDCPDGSDELCEGPICPYSSFQCGPNGRCVSFSAQCDGIKNCPNGEDERYCRPEQRNATQGCPDNTFQCANGQCLPKYEFCNAIPKCDDGSDESPESCKPQNLGKGLHLRRSKTQTRYCPMECGNGRCRSTAIVCSGRDGCGDNSDESHCTLCRCPKIRH